jgi:hypothetical protein
VFNSLPPSGVRYTEQLDWQQFNMFLLHRMNKKTAEDRLRYAKQYASVLTSVGIPTDLLLQLSPNKRIHVMKALSSLARFTGRTEEWRQMRQRYGLQWSTGTEKIDAFTRFFDLLRTWIQCCNGLGRLSKCCQPTMRISIYSVP